MYIPEFVGGVLATIAVEFVALFIYAMVRKRKER